jgi:hypothetical protein
MVRKHAGMIALAFAALLATSPVAAYADQWTGANLRRAEVNTRIANQNVRFQTQRLGGKIAAAKATAPRGDGRRTRTEHTALNRQANELSQQVMH